MVVVSYGITSRVAQRALQMARARGIRAGKFRLISAWPFPEPHIRELADASESVRGAGDESGPDGAGSGARRRRAGRKVIPVSHAGGSVHDPEAILDAIVEAAR